MLKKHSMLLRSLNVACMTGALRAKRGERDISRGARHVSRSPRLAHKAPVMQATWTKLSVKIRWNFLSAGHLVHLRLRPCPASGHLNTAWLANKKNISNWHQKAVSDMITFQRDFFFNKIHIEVLTYQPVALTDANQNNQSLLSLMLRILSRTDIKNLTSFQLPIRHTELL